MMQMTTMRRALEGLLLSKGAHWGLFLAYLAVLPIAGTIALRNVLLAVLALQSMIFVLTGDNKSESLAPGRLIPPGLYPWIAYVALFPLLAGDSVVAWRELRGQWIESLLAWFVTFVAVARSGLTLERLFSITLASAAYPVLYLGMFLWAWLGGFGNPSNISDMSPVQALLAAIGGMGQIGLPGWNSLPWGFRGFDPIHANLGVACAHAGIALMAYGILRWQAGLGVRVVPSVLLGAIVILPPFLANSRASILSIGLLVLLGLLAIWFFIRRSRQHAGSAARRVRTVHAGLALLIVIALGVLAFKVYKEDARWQAIYRKAMIGFVIHDPMSVVCSGYSAELERNLREHFVDLSAENVDREVALVKAGIEAVAQSVDGDLGRVLMARSGWELVRENPFPLDGSRSSYKRLMRERCGHVPYIDYAHSHQGWVDLALALGWIGAALYFGLMVCLLGVACVRMTKTSSVGWSSGLAMLCIFWIFRGFLDSVYREHYLQMQGALIGFFWRGLLQKDGHVAPRSLRYEGVKNE